MRRYAGLSLIALALFVLPPAADAGQIHEAVSRGDLRAVGALLKSDPGLIGARNEAALTPFLLAADSGNVAVAEFLLARGADLNEGDNEHTNALQLAALRNRFDMVNFLLARGMDVNGTDDNGMTALLFTAGRGNLEMVKTLVGRGARLDARTRGGMGVLNMAAYRGDVELIGYLLANGVPLDSAPDQYGNTPLLAAAWRNHEEAFRYLLEQGADLHVPGGQGRTVVHQAALGGSVEMLRLAAEAGCDINARDDEGTTPIIAATMAQKREAIDFLLGHGADPTLADRNGWTPLHFTPRTGDTALAAVYLARGANPNAATVNGVTPLMDAVQEDQRPLLEMLLDHGGDLRATEPHLGYGLLHLAAAGGYGEIVTALLARGAEVNARTASGETPLDLALRHGNSKVAEALRAKGAKAKAAKGNAAGKDLTRKVKPGEALVWYLGHAGWGIQTAQNFLVLDYFDVPAHADEPSLLNGCINPAELAGRKVTVFVSHAHMDHYSRSIFRWRDALPGITYILGFEPDTTVACECMGPHETRVVNGIEVTAFPSNDAGVGFVIAVDGLKIFHPGDHANRTPDLPNAYSAEIDFAAERSGGVDLAFFPVTGCGFNDLEALKAGIYRAVDTLHPRVVFPMHALQMEYKYGEFMREAKEKGCQLPMGCAEWRGDRFYYRDGKLTRL